MDIELVPLCEIDIVLSDPLVVGDGSQGLRIIYEVVSATVTGERLQGTHAGAASADWVLLHGDVATVDVRATFQTHDGALVLASYRGRTNLAGTAVTEAGTIYVAPTFETGDERYAWLNSVQAVGKGRLDGTDLHYEWYEVR